MVNHHVKALDRGLGIGLGGHAEREELGVSLAVRSLEIILGLACARVADLLVGLVPAGQAVMVLIIDFLEDYVLGVSACCRTSCCSRERDLLAARRILDAGLLGVVQEPGESKVREGRGYGLVRVGADLELGEGVRQVSVLVNTAHGAVQDMERAAEGGLLADALDLEGELVDLLLDGVALGVGVGAVRALERQGSHALEHVGDLLGCSLGDLAH